MQITKCFEILEVDNGAPWHVVKRSYYTLAKKLHPDVNPPDSDAEMKFKEIRPKTLGQALRIDGITPAAVYILLSYVKRRSIKQIA